MKIKLISWTSSTRYLFIFRRTSFNLDIIRIYISMFKINTFHTWLLFSRRCWFALVNEDISPFFLFILFNFFTFLHTYLCNTSYAEINTNFRWRLEPTVIFHFNFKFVSRHIWATAWSEPPLCMTFAQLLTLQCIILTIQNAYVI